MTFVFTSLSSLEPLSQFYPLPPPLEVPELTPRPLCSFVGFSIPVEARVTKGAIQAAVGFVLL